MQLINLPTEILIHITEYLPTKDILNLSICSKHFHDPLSFIKFNKRLNFKDICKSPYFDSFTSVIYSEPNNLFPKSLRNLYWYNNDQLPSHLLDTLINLYLGEEYVRPLSELPSSLQKLHLGLYYNQLMPQLPNSLKILEFGFNYNHPLPLLPDSLQYLRLGSYFKKPLPQLPNSLIELSLGYPYNKPLPQLPNTLERLYLGNKYNHPLPKLPNSLKHLRIGRTFKLPTLLSNITIDLVD